MIVIGVIEGMEGWHVDCPISVYAANTDLHPFAYAGTEVRRAWSNIDTIPLVFADEAESLAFIS